MSSPGIPSITAGCRGIDSMPIIGDLVIHCIVVALNHWLMMMFPLIDFHKQTLYTASDYYNSAF